MVGRRQLLGAAVGAPLLVSGCAATAAPAQTGHHDRGHPPGRGLRPVPTAEADWKPVAEALGRPGTLMADSTVYRVGFPRRDLAVTSYGVTVRAGLSLGSYGAFARYPDRKVMGMGDLVVLEAELPAVTDALHAAGLGQSAIHKHLLAHDPDLWWTHWHALGDPVAIARGLRAALDRTGTPPPVTPGPPPPLDLDLPGIDAAFGTPGRNDGGIYKFAFARDETVTVHGRVTPAATGVTTAIGFQPVGGDRAAINGDFVMVADEVPNVITALRAGGIDVVELHHHGLDDQPRLFYLHFWAIDDAVNLAHGLAAAIRATRVHPS